MYFFLNGEAPVLNLLVFAKLLNTSFFSKINKKNGEFNIKIKE